jgi:hypothetical protein
MLLWLSFYASLHGSNEPALVLNSSDQYVYLFCLILLAVNLDLDYTSDLTAELCICACDFISYLPTFVKKNFKCHSSCLRRANLMKLLAQNQCKVLKT